MAAGEAAHAVLENIKQVESVLMVAGGALIVVAGAWWWRRRLRRAERRNARTRPTE
jgi:uncharacterized membrane protein YidH (DUF202 family)